MAGGSRVKAMGTFAQNYCAGYIIFPVPVLEKVPEPGGSLGFFVVPSQHVGHSFIWFLYKIPMTVSL